MSVMNASTFQDMWNTRPVRRRAGRTVGGVCTGIGYRYRIDPTIVKVAFVVSAMFGGAGILVYLAALVALPSETDAAAHQLHDGGRAPWHRLPHGKWVPMAIIAVIGVAVVSSNNTWGSSGLLSAALLAAGWWLLHQRTPEPPLGTSADQLGTAAMGRPVPGTYPGAGYPGAGYSQSPFPGQHPVTPFPPISPTGVPYPTTPAPAVQTSPVASSGGTVVADPTTGATAGTDETAVSETTGSESSGSGTPTVSITKDAPSHGDSPTDTQAGDTAPIRSGEPADGGPPSWDPLGTAPFAWDLPEPTPPPPAPPAPRSPVTPIFLGLAVVAGTVGAGLNLVAGIDWFTPGRIASLVLAVLGAGLLVAALQRRPAGSRSSGLVPLAGVAAATVIAATVIGSDGGMFPAGGIGEREWRPQSATELRDRYELSMGSVTLDLRDLGALDRDRTVTVRQGMGEARVYLPTGIRVRTVCSVTMGDEKCPSGILNEGADTPLLTIDAQVKMGEVEMIR